MAAGLVRNYLTTGDFSIMEERSAQVLGYRSSYNTLRHDEWAAGFAYYLPLTRAHLQSAGIPEESFERFDARNAQGFRAMDSRRYRRRGAQLWTDDNPAIVGLDELGQRRWVNDTMADEAIARLLADPVQHLKVSLLLAWRGVFTEEGLGFPREPRDQRLANIAGWNDWARWGWAYGPIGASFFNLVSFLALIAVPLWLWAGSWPVRGDPRLPPGALWPWRLRHGIAVPAPLCGTPNSIARDSADDAVVSRLVVAPDSAGAARFRTDAGSGPCRYGADVRSKSCASISFLNRKISRGATRPGRCDGGNTCRGRRPQVFGRSLPSCP